MKNVPCWFLIKSLETIKYSYKTNQLAIKLIMFNYCKPMITKITILN